MIKLAKFSLGSNKISDKLFFAVFVFAYRLLLDLSYYLILSVNYKYYGFVNSITPLSYLVSWIILLAFSLFNFKNFINNNRISSEILYILFLLSVIPFTTMVGFGVFEVKLTACMVLFWAVCYFMQALFLRSRLRISIKPDAPYRVLDEKWIMLLTSLFCFAVLYISGRYTHFRFNFSLTNVYELRNEAKAMQLPRILSYLYSWSRVCIPIMMAYYFSKRKWIVGAACFLVLLLSFGIDGSKFVLFIALFAAVVAILPRIEIRKLNRLALFGVTLIVLASILFFLLFKKLQVYSLFVRRLVFVPLRITQCYFDFFTSNTPDYFRGSFMRLFGAVTPYPDMAKMIGGIYFNAPEMNANCGLVANAVANLGIPGCVIMPFIMMMVLYCMDLSAEGIDPRVYISAAVYASQALMNSALFTVLLTHGMMVIIVILALMKRDAMADERLSSQRRNCI